jgi:hypothetical protein
MCCMHERYIQEVSHLKQHAKRDAHKANIKAQSNTRSLPVHLSNKNSSQRSNETGARKLTVVFHTVSKT